MSHSPITRRELLKALLAASGAAALSTVPNQWKTPVVEVGALPAHAQGSLRGSITANIRGPSGGARAQVQGVSPTAPPRVSLGGPAPAGPVDANGSAPSYSYTFTGLPAGNYTVTVTPPGAGICPTLCVLTPPSPAPVSLAAGGSETVNFSYETIN